ncbi:hypothetical protein JCM14450A_12410 [Geobacillus stearothermophilus]
MERKGSMMNGQPLSALQLLFMVMLSVGLMNHVIIIPFMLEAAHRDAWNRRLGSVGVFARLAAAALFHHPTTERRAAV